MANKFEKKALTQVNQLDEGLLFGILKFFLKAKTKRVLRKLNKDSEFKAAVADMNYHAQRAKDLIRQAEEEGYDIDPRLKRRR